MYQMDLNEKWKLTTQNNAYLWEGNQISKQNRYPCLGRKAPSRDMASLFDYLAAFDATPSLTQAQEN